ncbi:MAG TPA: hypothetical protein VN541_05675, partial [Tepidisphaeraceae bacterium]|nr:hypothetical protein [Tepidisphaeraceae bacterium]
MSNVLNGIRPLLGDHRKAHRAVGIALAVPTVLVVLCCGYIGWAYAEGRTRTVWLVNGLDRDYDVNLNGRTVHLDAFSQQRIRIAEGEIHVTSVDHSLPLAEQSCEIDTPLLTRPFDQTTFVINPDRAALLYEDQTLYATDIREARDSDQRHYFTGELLYRVSGVDYAFAPFPETVKVSGGRVQKKRLALLSEGDEFHRLRLIGNEISREAATEYACTQALCYPDDRQALVVALSRMQPPDAMKFLRAGLDHRPVWLVWHRMYQETSQRMRPEFDLAGEYRGLLAAEPNDATLMYLLGRVTPDDAERDKLFQQSTRGSKPCAFGFFALAYEALAQGDFEPALLMIDKAMSLAPNQEQFRGVKIES